MNFKEQSIKAYQNRFRAGSANPDQVRSYVLLNPKQPKMIHDKNDEYINRCFKDIIGKIDEMNMNTELLKVKKQNLVGKYGGEEFWNDFVGSLYVKLMKNENLSKFFKLSDLKMITVGMFKLFNGCATLDFRRKIKLAHEYMGICDKDFVAYSNYFEETLNNFEIDTEDKKSIMSQIKSMKYLICRSSYN